MTTHLSPQEFVSALDETLAPARQAHLAECPSCQERVAELRAVMAEVAQDSEVPEPSPLFWDHFQARVLTAAQHESPASPRSFWANWADTRAFVAIAATLVAVVASVSFFMSRTVTPVPESMTEAGAAVESADTIPARADLDNEEWEFVASVMGTLEGDDVDEVLAPSRGAVDAAIESLTTDERNRLVQLLKAEMGQGLE